MTTETGRAGRRTAETVGPLDLATGITLRIARSGLARPGEPTLVLAHGWSQDLRTWDRVVGDLRRAGVTASILRYDHRGHGGSESPGRGAPRSGAPRTTSPRSSPTTSRARSCWPGTRWAG